MGSARRMPLRTTLNSEFENAGSNPAVPRKWGVSQWEALSRLHNLLSSGNYYARVPPYSVGHH